MLKKMMCALFCLVLLCGATCLSEQVNEFVLDTVGKNYDKTFNIIDSIVNNPLPYEGKRVRVGGYFERSIIPCDHDDHDHEEAVYTQNEWDLDFYLSFADPRACCYHDGRVDLKLIISDELAEQLPKQDQYFTVEGTVIVEYYGKVAEGKLIVESIVTEDRDVTEYMNDVW